MPNICKDIYKANVNGFLRELKNKASKMKSVQANADQSGDYAHTVGCVVGVVEAAIAAAIAESEKNLAVDPQEPNPFQGLSDPQ